MPTIVASLYLTSIQAEEILTGISVLINLAKS